MVNVMKRYGNLWDKLVSWENLVMAAHKAASGKRSRQSVQNFEFDAERQLLNLQRQLQQQSYRPGSFRTHWIYLPKKRMISVAPYRDRVIHHAVMNILEPILDRHFHPDSYACRLKKGTHAAADRLQKMMRKNKYALQCDIQRFFPSIDHGNLKTIFRRLIKDNRVLWLMDLIVDSSNAQPGDIQWFTGDDLFSPILRRKGLPIGNLTSQWFANWCLNGLDHFITSHLKIGAYVRYCDDFVILHNDKKHLKDALNQVEVYLDSLRLKLHPNKLSIRPVRAGLTFVGFRIWPTRRKLKKENVRAFRRRLVWMKQAYSERLLEWEDIRPRLDSWIAHASHADSKYLLRRLSEDWKFTRGKAAYESCYPRRCVEQQCNELCGDQPQQQHAVQSQQQHRIPSRPALSDNEFFFTRNRKVYGSCGRGVESPGLAPVSQPFSVGSGRIIAAQSVGSGRINIRKPRPAYLKRNVSGRRGQVA